MNIRLGCREVKKGTIGRTQDDQCYLWKAGNSEDEQGLEDDDEKTVSIRRD